MVDPGAAPAAAVDGRFVFTAEHRALRAAVRHFCATHVAGQDEQHPPSGPERSDAAVWARLGCELGVIGLATPEHAGGAGGTVVDQAIVAEELGAALAGGPVVGTMYLAVPLLTAATPGPGRDELLRDLCSGTRTAAVAAPELSGGHAPAPVPARAESRGDRWIVSGDLGAVADAGSADVLLVAAATPDGPALLAVEGMVAGVERTPLVTLDLTRPQSRVRLTDAPARLVAGPRETEQVTAHAWRTACVLLAAEQVGGAQHLLDLTVAHLKQRFQFGRAIGSFQAVKHRAVDMLVAVEQARSTAFHAAWALDSGDDDPDLAASIAQATCTTAFSRVAADAIHLHGGIGFTWEHEAHRYFKRAVTDAALLGGAELHRDRVARRVLDRADPSSAPPVAAGAPM